MVVYTPRIGITMGDPCGVGPEIIVKALSNAEIRDRCRPVVIGDPVALQRAIDLLGSDLGIHICPAISRLEWHPDRIALFAPSRLHAEDIPWGRPNRKAAQATIEYIQYAAQAAMKGEIDAVCTCPIHKANLYSHGFSFPGHTEFIAHLTNTQDVVMMLAGPLLRVALATIHQALSTVPAALDTSRLHRTIEITASGLLRDFGIPAPRIAVAALNPHAGEGGKFGMEEVEIIQPAIERFNSSSFSVSGPFPPDTLFYRAYMGEFDAVVAMYHDQGLIPIKLVHFHNAVNVTLGLPIIRTSVDHGTAYDLAGTRKASEGSLVEAIRLAGLMASNRSKA